MPSNPSDDEKDQPGTLEGVRAVPVAAKPEPVRRSNPTIVFSREDDELLQPVASEPPAPPPMPATPKPPPLPVGAGGGPPPLPVAGSGGTPPPLPTAAATPPPLPISDARRVATTPDSPPPEERRAARTMVPPDPPEGLDQDESAPTVAVVTRPEIDAAVGKAQVKAVARPPVAAAEPVEQVSGGMAAVISLFLPGAGQIYLGQTVKGGVMLVLALISCGCFGLLNLIAAADAWMLAAKRNQGKQLGDWEMF